MERIIDITGEIHTGMWSYGFPYPEVTVRPMTKVDWVEYNTHAEVIEGFNSQCGTYLETPAHYLGDKSYPLIDVPVSKLLDVPTVIIDLGDLSKARTAITREMVENNPAAKYITPGCVILLCAHWGKKWDDADYLSMSPYITLEAMQYLVDQKPFIMGSDFPTWDNVQNTQGFWDVFYNSDILMLAPCVNLEEVGAPTAKLTVLPLKVEKTCCIPCRAILKAE